MEDRRGNDMLHQAILDQVTEIKGIVSKNSDKINNIETKLFNGINEKIDDHGKRLDRSEIVTETVRRLALLLIIATPIVGTIAGIIFAG